MSSGTDQAEALCQAVRRAYEHAGSLRITGSGSKSFLTRSAERTDGGASQPLLSVADHVGVIDYRPEELVITARAGTTLKDIERVLAQAGQHLAFEPPRFRGRGTLGGAVACGLAGPGRPWWGSVRDTLLGVELVNGRGERLRFGGQVMKNVAGYDVARLQAGAFGTLGLLLSVSVKVLPVPSVLETRRFELTPAEALARCRAWARRSHPITGTCYLDGTLRVRLSGAEPAVRQSGSELGGEAEPDPQFWEALRDHRLQAFAEDGLWRCSVPPAASGPLDGCLVSWGGAERWWRPDRGSDPARVAAEQGGHARPFDGSFGIRNGAHLSPGERRYTSRLKKAFDPGGVLNPELCPLTEDARAD